MIKEFKEFISKGNVIDLAVGIIIGGAFGKIVSSFVGDIIMPVIGMIFGGISFSGLSVAIGDSTLNYGLFIQAIVDFLIIALVIFFMIKLINKMRRKKAEEPKAPPAPPRDEVLLEEIRDLLKEHNER